MYDEIEFWELRKNVLVNSTCTFDHCGQQRLLVAGGGNNLVSLGSQWGKITLTNLPLQSVPEDADLVSLTGFAAGVDKFARGKMKGRQSILAVAFAVPPRSRHASDASEEENHHGPLGMVSTLHRDENHGSGIFSHTDGRERKVSSDDVHPSPDVQEVETSMLNIYAQYDGPGDYEPEDDLKSFTAKPSQQLLLPYKPLQMSRAELPIPFTHNSADFLLISGMDANIHFYKQRRQQTLARGRLSSLGLEETHNPLDSPAFLPKGSLADDPKLNTGLLSREQLLDHRDKGSFDHGSSTSTSSSPSSSSSSSSSLSDTADGSNGGVKQRHAAASRRRKGTGEGSMSASYDGGGDDDEEEEEEDDDDDEYDDDDYDDDEDDDDDDYEHSGSSQTSGSVREYDSSREQDAAPQNLSMLHDVSIRLRSHISDASSTGIYDPTHDQQVPLEYLTSLESPVLTFRPQTLDRTRSSQLLAAGCLDGTLIVVSKNLDYHAVAATKASTRLKGPINTLSLLNSEQSGEKTNIIVGGGFGYAAVVESSVTAGESHLSEPQLLPGSDTHDSVLCSCVADFNWDGREEVAIGTFGQQLIVYENIEEGQGLSEASARQQKDGESKSFAKLWERPFAFPISSIDCGDFNQDGVEELVVNTLGGVHVLQPDLESVADKVMMSLFGATELKAAQRTALA